MGPASANCLFKRVHGALRLLFLLAVSAAAPAVEAAGTADAALWQALRDGEAFAVMRHATAPGTGDPDNFAIGDCSTQRNLSDAGREQARAIGRRFRDNGIAEAAVFTSQWCRCRDTAALLGLGEAGDLPALNSFFRRPDEKESRMRALRAWLSEADFGMPLVLVTHQVNITALTGEYTVSGEVLAVRREPDGSMTVLGSLGD